MTQGLVVPSLIVNYSGYVWPFSDEPTAKFSCAVVCAKSCILPPQTETVIPARTKDRSWVGFVGVFEPSAGLSERFEVYGTASMVVEGQYDTIPVRIMNSTARLIRLYRYSTLGLFEAEDKEVLTVDLEEAGYPPELPKSAQTRADAVDFSEADLPMDRRQRLLILRSSYRDFFAQDIKETQEIS